MSDETPRLRDLIRQRSVTGRVDVTGEVERSLPLGLRVASAYSWRFLVIAGSIGVLIWLVIQFKILVIPLLVAILLTALLWPAVNALLRAHLPRWLAIVLTLLGTAIVVGGLLWLAVWQITQQWSDVQTRTVAAVDQLRQFLIQGPLHLLSLIHI